MKYEIQYHYLRDEGPFSPPPYDHSEFVEVDSPKKLKNYIESKKDLYGHPFKKKDSLGFQYISNCGGVKIKSHREPKFKKL